MQIHLGFKNYLNINSILDFFDFHSHSNSFFNFLVQV